MLVLCALPEWVGLSVCTVYCVSCIMCSLATVHSVQCAVPFVQCPVCVVQFWVMYAVLSSLCAVYFEWYPLCCTLCAISSVPVCKGVGGAFGQAANDTLTQRARVVAAL